MKQSIFLLFAAFVLSSCFQDRNREMEAEILERKKELVKVQEEHKTEVQELERRNMARLITRDLGEDEMSMPQQEVSVQISDMNFIIDTIPGASPIPAEDYANYDIPKDAISAAGGWYAGAGDYYYLTLTKNDRLFLYYGWQDEMQEGAGFHWKKIREF